MTTTATIDGSRFAYAVSLRNSGAITATGAALPSSASVAALPLVPTALARVPDGGINFAPTQTTLLSDFDSIMGNAGDDSDGFDLILADALLDIDSDTLGFAALGDTVALADFVPGALDSLEFAPIAQDVIDFVQVGQPLADAVAGATTNTVTAPAQPPAPTQPPGTPTGGGGGGREGPQPIPLPCSDFDCDPLGNPDRSL